jgi:hypothetical protein
MTETVSVTETVHNEEGFEWFRGFVQLRGLTSASPRTTPLQLAWFGRLTATLT